MKSFLQKINAQTIVVALLTFIIGWQLGHRDLSLQWKDYKPNVSFTNNQPPQGAQNIDFNLFWNVWDLVSKEYVDKKAVDPQKMYYGAIQGMVQALGDPYTVFLPPEAQKATTEDLGGSFEGVGIELGYNKDKQLSVIAPLPGSPADKAGVKPGDIIVKINGKDSTTMSLPDAVKQIRGQKGTSVNLDVYHEGATKTQAVTLTRDTIVVKSVTFSTKNTPKGEKVAYIQLTRFGERTVDEWNKAVSDALAAGVQGVVLDMRNNPGGFLDDAVYIGSEFIDKGNIVQHEDGKGDKQGYPVNRIGKMLKMPLVVLINKGSASASEIVAGAIQDNKRGKLVGDQSFGKGTIQQSQTLPGGTGIHITTAKWLTPAGRWIHGTGLTPDVKVEATDSAQPATNGTKPDPQLDQALQVLDQS